MTKAAEAGAKHGKPAQGEPSERGLIVLRTYEPQQVNGREAYRRDRYRRRQTAQRWEVRRARRDAGLDPNGSEGEAKASRRVFCGKPLQFNGSVAVRMSHGADGKARAHYGNLQHCGSVWACPVCSAIIRRARAEEIAEAAKRHLANGGGLALVTYTVQHVRSDRLADSWALLRDAYAAMARSRGYREWKRRAGVSGSISAFEVTFGKNGWHPHRHSLVFLDNPVSENEAKELEGDLFSMWSYQVERAGGRTVSREAFDVRPVRRGEESLAAYVSKLGGADGIAKELSLADVKNGRAGNISPFALLDIATAEAERLWDEYVQATAGRSAIRWSRGLRDALGMSGEKTDAEVMDDLEAVGGPVALIGRELYAERLAGRPGALCAVLEAAETGKLGELLPGLLGSEAYFVQTEDGPVPMYLRRSSSLAA